MTTVSSVSPSNLYGYTQSAKNAGDSVSTASNGGEKPAAPSSVAGTSASSGAGAAAPLTYNAAGLLAAFGQATANTGATTSQLAAQKAVADAQNVINQTLDSLMSGSSGSSSATDIFALNTAATGANPAGPAVGTASNQPAGTSKAASVTAQAAQNAYLAAQNALTKSLNSLA